MKRNSSNKVERRLQCEYLLTDGSGSLLQLFEEYRNGVRIGETADLTLGYCKVLVWESYSQSHAYRQDKPCGRIVLHRKESSFSKLAKGGLVKATAPSTDGGSDNSKRLSYEVQYVWLETKSGDKLHWCDVTSIISSQFTVQVGDAYNLPVRLEVGYQIWSGGPMLNKLTDLRPKTPEFMLDKSA